MSDITTIWDNADGQGRGDYALAGADLQNGFDLQTAILISLFTDRAAKASDSIPDGSNDRRGWWGDADNPDIYPIGSRLWLLDRSKLTNAVALAAKDYAAEALQWLIDDGVVAGFSFATQINPPNQLWLTIQVFNTAADQAKGKYAWTWTGPIIYPSGP